MQHQKTHRSGRYRIDVSFVFIRIVQLKRENCVGLKNFYQENGTETFIDDDEFHDGMDGNGAITFVVSNFSNF